ncbi:hypothetical protein WICPIJ_001445, partial [Wickerhamomyces pijperi]
MTLANDDFLNKVRQLDLQRQQQSQTFTISIPNPIAARTSTELSSKDQGFLSSDDEDEDYHSRDDLKFKSAYNYEKSMNRNDGSIPPTKPKRPVKPESLTQLVSAPRLPKRPPQVSETDSDSESETETETAQFRRSMGGSYIHHEKVHMPDIIRFDDYKSNFNEKYAEKYGHQTQTQTQTQAERKEKYQGQSKTKNGFVLTEEQLKNLDSTINDLIYNDSAEQDKIKIKPLAPPKPPHLVKPGNTGTSPLRYATATNTSSSSPASSSTQQIPKSPKKLNLSTYAASATSTATAPSSIPALNLNLPQKPAKSTYISSIQTHSTSKNQALPTTSDTRIQTSASSNGWLSSMMSHSTEAKPQGLKTGYNAKIRIPSVVNAPPQDLADSNVEDNVPSLNGGKPPVIPKKSSTVLRKVSGNSQRLIHVKAGLKPAATTTDAAKSDSEKGHVEKMGKPVIKPKPALPSHQPPAPAPQAQSIVLPKLRPVKPSATTKPQYIPSAAEANLTASQNSIPSPSKLKELERTKRIVSGNTAMLNKSLRGLRSVNAEQNSNEQNNTNNNTFDSEEKDLLKRSLQGLKSNKGDDIVKKDYEHEKKELLKSSITGLKSANNIKPDHETNQSQSRSQMNSILEGLILRKIHTDPSLPISSPTPSTTTDPVLKKAQTFDLS